MYAATRSVALVGGDATEVRVEAHVGRQMEAFRLSGLPDSAVREAKTRVRAAIASSGVRFPNREVTINLAPADTPKAGTDYDLAIALGILSASREVPHIADAILVGELALDGSVRPTPNTFGAGVLSARTGRPCIVASQAAGEAAAVPGAKAFGVSSLADAVDLLRDGIHRVRPVSPERVDTRQDHLDMRDVRGQPLARRALEIAAAGGHHLLLHGPPGGGKTMLARRLPGILPQLTGEQAIEVALMWAAAGLHRGIDLTPPFRAPHHTASRAALVGGGSGLPRPGEASLATAGVLFLDELAEYPRSHLDTLRQPLEEGVVVVARKDATFRFTASFQLVAATNPCPCGFFGDHRRPCECPPAQRLRYRSRLSGPMLDRFDLVVHVPRVEAGHYAGEPGEASAAVRERVVVARKMADDRCRRPRGEEGQVVEVGRDGMALIVAGVDNGLLTARGADRVRRVARSIADLDGSPVVGEAHVAEALVLRGVWPAG